MPASTGRVSSSGAGAHEGGEAEGRRVHEVHAGRAGDDRAGDAGRADGQRGEQDDERDEERIDGVGLAAAWATVGEVRGDHDDARQEPTPERQRRAPGRRSPRADCRGTTAMATPSSSGTTTRNARPNQRKVVAGRWCRTAGTCRRCRCARPSRACRPPARRPQPGARPDVEPPDPRVIGRHQPPGDPGGRGGHRWRSGRRAGRIRLGGVRPLRSRVGDRHARPLGGGPGSRWRWSGSMSGGHYPPLRTGPELRGPSAGVPLCSPPGAHQDVGGHGAEEDRDVRDREREDLHRPARCRVAHEAHTARRRWRRARPRSRRRSTRGRRRARGPASRPTGRPV